MTDQHEKLRRALTDLSAQLEELREVDPEVAKRVDATLEQARAVLAGRPGGEKEARSLGDQLRDSVLEYEASHPRLAQYLGGVIDALAQIGI
jgi:hypothetical protein